MQPVAQGSSRESRANSSQSTLARSYATRRTVEGSPGKLGGQILLYSAPHTCVLHRGASYSSGLSDFDRRPNSAPHTCALHCIVELRALRETEGQNSKAACRTAKCGPVRPCSGLSDLDRRPALPQCVARHRCAMCRAAKLRALQPRLKANIA